MKRPASILYFLYCVTVLLLIVCVFGFIIIICTFINNEKSINFIYKTLRVIAIVWASLVGMRFKTMNKKRPQAVRGPNIFIVNHNSYLDAISVLISVPQPYRMLGKHELNNLPFIGFFYKRIVLSVDRDDIYDRAASLKKMSKTLQSGMSIVLFPEGTFNETMQIFKSFHDGAFNLAISTKTAIVPILILDNKKRMNPRSIFSINPGISRIMMLDAVNSVPEDNTSSLKMKAIDVMEKAWNNYY